jgi:calcineurin-like phosphoesterase family protein
MADQTPNLVGEGGRLFAEPTASPDETSFQVDNTSQAYYESPYYTKHQGDLQPVPTPRADPPRLDLGEVLGQDLIDSITEAKRISFHAVGDTGAARNDAIQHAATSIAHEAGVADAMARDVAAGGEDAPAFFFHLGDVVYDFGEAQYYYDQFYEPFRNYDRPIFAIPGNHDGVVFGPDPDHPEIPSLTAFLRNFCAESPGPSPDAGTLMRSAMTQPGVYFTLDAPWVSIIGLYTNVLEGPGVISSEGGQYPLGDDQLTFLTAELRRLKPERERGERAVILACHHPPTSVDAEHGGTLGLSNDIDRAAQDAELWPDAVLSGHAHLYQRFTRSTAGREIPYVVSGSGGYTAKAPLSTVTPPAVAGEFTLVGPPTVAFGYLTVTVDIGKRTLTITFHPSDPNVAGDAVVVDLATSRLGWVGS